MSDNTVILEVKELHKSFDGHEVLKGISTTIKKGDVLALNTPTPNTKTTKIPTIKHKHKTGDSDGGACAV